MTLVSHSTVLRVGESLREEGGRRKEEGGRRKEEGGRRKEEGGRRKCLCVLCAVVPECADLWCTLVLADGAH